MSALQIICGDALEKLRELPSESVQCCVTSPPFWGLRNYGVEGQLGLEKTPEEYMAKMVEVFHEVRRVLRNDGTLWLNLGDTYAGGSRGGGAAGCKQQTNVGSLIEDTPLPPGYKRTDLVGIPWRVAFALRADGWYLRRDNIWFKPNPMPESVNGWRWEKHRIKTAPSARAVSSHSHSLAQTGVNNPQGAREGVNFADHSTEYADCPGCEKCIPNGGLVLRKSNWRCTTSHEYVFQFAKSSDYFCNAEAAREQGVQPDRIRLDRIGGANGHKVRHSVGGLVGRTTNRNRRSVWRIPTAPYPEAHFATFPPALVRPIILTATSPKVCAECGTPYAPVVERGEPRREQQIACGSNGDGEYHGEATKDFFSNGAEDASVVKSRILAGMVEKRVTSFRATCSCNSDTIRATVLDPFAGSGTTGQVALELGRKVILIELNAKYVELIEQRCNVTLGLAL